MELNSTQKKGIVILAIGIIMIIFIISSKIKNNFFKNSNTTNTENNTSQVQLEDVTIEEDADYMEPINVYMQGIIEKDAAKMKSVIPSVEQNDVNSDEQINTLYTEWEKACGANIKISYNITKVQKVDSETIKSIETEIRNQYTNFTDTIEDINYVTVHFNITGDTDIEEEDTAIIIGKINGTWYVF